MSAGDTDLSKTNTNRVSTPLSEMFARIEREADGGLLDGLQVFRSPVAKVDGVDDLPNVILMEYNDREESHVAGAKTKREYGSLKGAIGRSTNIIRAECTAFFLLSFMKDAGAFSPDGEKPYGALDWVARFKDSLERDTDGSSDLMLGGTCVEPMYIHTGDNEVRDLSWSILFEVEFYPAPFPRGSRHGIWTHTK